MRTNEERQRLADAIREEDSKPESIDAWPSQMHRLRLFCGSDPLVSETVIQAIEASLKRIANLETALRSIAEKVCREDAEWIDTVLDGSAFNDVT